MKKAKFTTQAKKDLRRYANAPKRLTAILDTIQRLCRGEQLPDNYHVHPLRGIFQGCLECHVMGDTLLIWIDETDDNTIKVVRIGTHHQLFGL